MADNYLENQYELYLQRKEAWLRKKNKHPKIKKQLERPDDEAL